MKKLAKPVLAEGELTGHAHVIDAPVDVFVCEDSTRTFVATAPVVVRHEEHKEVVIPAGEYISDRVRECDHFAEEARKVRD